MNNNDSQEISLKDLSKKLDKLFNRIHLWIFLFFKFIFKNILLLTLFIVIGVAIGYYIDLNKDNNRFKYEIIVIPNVGSQSFLYKEIKNIDFKKQKYLISADIEPIIDIYDFISSNGENLKIAEFLADNNVKLVKHSPGNETEQVYKFHLITFYTKNEQNGDAEINNFLSNLNKEKYFKEKLEINQIYLENKISENLKSIENINNLFQNIGNSNKSSSNVNIEVFTEINKLIENKQYIIDDNKKLSNELVENENVIFNVAKINTNNRKNAFFIFVIPTILIFIYSLTLFFKYSKNKFKSIEAK